MLLYAIAQILLQTTPTAYQLAPLVIIVILILGAVGLTRGGDIFQLFGVGALLGLTNPRGITGSGVGKGLRSGGIRTRILAAPAVKGAGTTVGTGTKAIIAKPATAKAAQQASRQSIIDAGAAAAGGAAAGGSGGGGSGGGGGGGGSGGGAGDPDAGRVALSTSRGARSAGASNWRAGRLFAASGRLHTRLDKESGFVSGKLNPAKERYAANPTLTNAARLKVTQLRYTRGLDKNDNLKRAGVIGTLFPTLKYGYAAKTERASKALQNQQYKTAKSILKSKGMWKGAKANAAKVGKETAAQFAAEKGVSTSRWYDTAAIGQSGAALGGAWSSWKGRKTAPSRGNTWGETLSARTGTALQARRDERARKETARAEAEERKGTRVERLKDRSNTYSEKLLKDRTEEKYKPKPGTRAARIEAAEDRRTDQKAANIETEKEGSEVETEAQKQQKRKKDMQDTKENASEGGGT